MHFDNNGSGIKCASLYSYLVRVNQLLVFHSAFTNLIDLVIYNVVYVSLRIQAWRPPLPRCSGSVWTALPVSPRRERRLKTLFQSRATWSQVGKSRQPRTFGLWHCSKVYSLSNVIYHGSCSSRRCCQELVRCRLLRQCICRDYLPVHCVTSAGCTLSLGGVQVSLLRKRSDGFHHGDVGTAFRGCMFL